MEPNELTIHRQLKNDNLPENWREDGPVGKTSTF